jgi:alpha-galactosidase
MRAGTRAVATGPTRAPGSARGIRGNLWFEPERVRRGTWLATEHPGWVFWGDGEGLLNLGNPDAWQWLLDHVDRMITREGIDFYRQDFNTDPLPYWRPQDAEDRQGITEIRYVTGLLAFWDELLRRHPDVLYDNCASGGRRNDLESMRRGVPYTKSDYAYEPVAVQGETYGISLWLPYFAATWESSDDPYLCRSRFAHVVGAILHPSVEGHFSALPQRLEEWRKTVRCYWGDFWPLTPYSLDNSAWIAWQFDVPETGEGVVQAFRRAECPTESLVVKLRGLNPRAHYTLTDVGTPGSKSMSGEDLTAEGLQLTSPTRPAALIVTYNRER